MQTVDTFEWRFGGWLTGVPVGVGWAVLVLLLVLAVAVTHWSYRRSLRSVSRVRRTTLFALRSSFVFILLLCLANPTRVQRTTLDAPEQKPLIVLVDQSDSMTQKDNRGRSRLDEARRVWEQIRPLAEEKFGGIEYYGFSSDVRRLGSLEEALKPVAGGDQTRLMAALSDLLGKKRDDKDAGVILTLSDGLDTSNDTVDPVRALAIQSATHLFFLSAANRTRSAPVLRIRELDAPSRVLRQSDFNVQAVIENFAASDGSLRIRILEGDVVIAEDEQAVRKGNNLLTWSRDIASGETGDRDLTLEVSGGNKTKRVEHRVAVVEKKPVHVLYYQGALDWGFRFLNTVLSRDPGFHVTALFNPSIAGRVRTGGGDPGALTDLPSKAGDLQPYQIVILANVFADQLSDAQQRALDEYTRGGGGLLFIQPNDQGTMAFSGTRLESILPVVFEDKPAPKSAETEAERFRRQMAAQNQVTFEDPFAVATARPPDALLPFAFPEESPLAEILRLPGDDGKLIHPQFVEYARVRSVKPGAEILATHPKDRTARGEPRVLLATQKFGKGRASVLSTDSLWRWRLSLPSDSVEVATFWQQLLMWLSAAPSKDLRFQEKWTEASNQTPVTLTVINSPNRPEVRILAPNGSERDGDPQQGAEAAQWVIRWTPDQTGIWQVSARSATGDFAGKSITVVAPGDVPDLANLPPNLETMRALALATGGQMIADGVAPSDWRSGGAAPPPLVLSEHRQPAWNTWWLLCLCLGVYAAELILRRRWQLI